MFSSATPAKKVHARASAAARRSQSRAGSLAPATPVRRSQRTALREPEPARNDEESDEEHAGASGDVLDSDGTLLKTDTHSVSRYSAELPTEVKQILANSDFYSHPLAALIDHEAGYACLLSREHCYVWSLARTSSSFSPTCYSFPVPPPPSFSLSAAVYSPVPFAAFVNTSSTSSSSSAREPGFLMITTLGQVSFWTAVTAALGSVDRLAQADLALAQSEVVRAVHKLSPTHFIAATSGARLLSVKISNALISSSASIQVSPFSRSRGVLARVGGLFGSGNAIDPRGGVVAVTSSLAHGAKGSRNVYATSDKAIQAWKLAEGSYEQFLYEHDIHELLLDALLSANAEGLASNFQPEIIDAKANGQDKLVLLVAYFVNSTNGSSVRGAQQSRQQHAYTLVTIVGTTITHLKLLSFKHDPDPRPLSTPKLVLADNDADPGLVLVVFPDMMLATCLSSKISFEEAIPLRDASKDRLLGACMATSSSFILLAASSGLLHLAFNIETMASRTGPSTTLDGETLATQHLKTKLVQAVSFGDKSKNPLAFDLKLDNGGDLVTAAEKVSKKILSSTSPFLPNIIDLRARLQDRSLRLRFLIIFIQENNLISRLSKTSRRHLAWDAERVKVASALWSVQNIRIASFDDEHGTLVEQAINQLKIPNLNAADPVRDFFKSHLEHIGLVLTHLQLVAESALRRSSDLRTRTDIVHQIAEAFTASYRAIISFRSENSHLYGLDESQTCLSEPWSSRSQILDCLRFTLKQLEETIARRSRELGSGVDDEDSTAIDDRKSAAGDDTEKTRQRELKDFLASLADYTLKMHQERIAYLQSLDNEAEAVAELRSLMNIYEELRGYVIQVLVRYSRVDVAFDLAERYRDFRSLVLLCESSTGSQIRTQFYIEKYKKDFAFALYSWYIEHNKQYELMSQDPVYWDLLSEFLHTRGQKRYSWMLDIAQNKYQTASAALEKAAVIEKQLQVQKVMLSIGKLAQAAGLTRESLERPADAKTPLKDFNSQLDLVVSQEIFADACASLLDPRDGKLSLQEKAAVCTQRLCSHLEGVQQEMVSILLQQVLSGQTINPEDVIDLYTLQDNAGPENEKHFYKALQIVQADNSIPPARLQLALKAIWRRVFLHNDWTELRQSTNSLSDEAIRTALMSTAAFGVLFALANQQEGHDAILTQRPSQCLFEATQEDMSALQARLSNSPAFESLSVEAVASEYQRESDELRSLLDEHGTKLEEFYDEMERLVEDENARSEDWKASSFDQTANSLDESMGVV